MKEKLLAIGSSVWKYANTHVGSVLVGGLTAYVLTKGSREKELLETKKKGSLEDRIFQMEEERKTASRRELREAVTEAISKWGKDFKNDWTEIEEQVTMFIKRGLTAKDAMRRSYLALHPEAAEAESKIIAQENANATGSFQSGGGYRPTIIDTKESPQLNERERKVAKDLLGKDFGNGQVLFKSEEDYAKLLKKHEGYLKSSGFYNLP